VSEPSEAPPAPRRRLSAADRRAAILEAALQVFSERGFKQASLDEVAERGGVSKALIYEHFASKRELQLALLDAYVHDLIDRVVRASAAVEAPEDRLRAGIEALLEFAGCAVVISHDRWFLDRIATHILAFEGDSHVEWFEGNYQEYEADRKRRLGAAAEQPHRIKYRKLTR